MKTGTIQCYSLQLLEISSPETFAMMSDSTVLFDMASLGQPQEIMWLQCYSLQLKDISSSETLDIRFYSLCGSNDSNLHKEIAGMKT